jgi:hypothetical protein
MMLSPLALSQNCLVITACDGGKHMYYIRERKWEKCVDSAAASKAFQFPDLTALHNEGISDDAITNVNKLLETVPMYNIVCKLTSTAGRPMLFAILVPSTAQDLYHPRLLFVRSSKTVASAKVVQKVYKIANRKSFVGRIKLESGYNLEFPAEGTTIKPTLAALSMAKSSLTPYTEKAAERQKQWLNLLGGAQTPVALKKPKSGQGHTLELQNVDVNLIARKLANPLEAEARLRVNVAEYKGGGLRSKPLQSTASFKNLLHSITGVGDCPGEQYIVQRAPLSDYHISLKDRFFGMKHTPSTIINAVNGTRELARQMNMTEGDFQQILNAIMSSFFEDIGWRLADVPAVAEAEISKAVVDIDQVQMCTRRHIRYCY